MSRRIAFRTITGHSEYALDYVAREELGKRLAFHGRIDKYAGCRWHCSVRAGIQAFGVVYDVD